VTTLLDSVQGCDNLVRFMHKVVATLLQPCCVITWLLQPWVFCMGSRCSYSHIPT